MKWIDSLKKLPSKNGPYLCYIRVPFGNNCKSEFIYMIVNYNNKHGFITNFNPWAFVKYWCILKDPTTIETITKCPTCGSEVDVHSDGETQKYIPKDD